MGRESPDVEGLLQELVERQRLLERLSKIQASMSHRQPLQDVLDAITQGAAELIGDEVVGLRLTDPNDPEYVVVVSSVGLDEDTLKKIQRTPAREGAGGKATLENRLVVIENYADSPQGLGLFRQRRLQAALAAPVKEEGRPIGSLVVATYQPGRTYSESEKDALMSLADHAGLALADARTVEKMREAQRDRDMFLAMVSHELKTPLTVIMGALQMLERQVDKLESPRARNIVNSAAERGRELARMIDLLLQGASAEIAVDVQEVPLEDLLKDAAGGFDHTLRVQIEPVSRVSCRVDVASVGRILGILIENALAHSPSSSPVRLGANVEGNRLILWVENEGSLPEDVDSLFEPFRRGEEASSPGVGLGLHIAQRIAGTLEGSVIAGSSPGSVRFELHLARIGDPQGLSGAPTTSDDSVLTEDV